MVVLHSRQCTNHNLLSLGILSLATFRLQYEDDYEFEFSILSTRFRLEGENFRSARAQNLKLVLVVVLVLQSEGRYC